MAPLAPYAAVQRKEMGLTAAGEGGTTAKQAPTSTRHDGDVGIGATALESEVPGQGWSEALAGAYASNFYAGPVLPPGTERGPQHCVTEEPDTPAGMARCDPATEVRSGETPSAGATAAPPLGLHGTPAQTMRIMCSCW